jgi:HlyD family secretion protein
MLQKTPEMPHSDSQPHDLGLAAMLAARPANPRRRLLIAGGVALVLVAGFAVWLNSGSSRTTVSYTTQPVTHGDLTVSVTATGTVQPTNQVSISSELSGTVRAVLADYNDRVKKGDVLARLDTDKLNAALALAKATEAARRADVTQAEATVAETASMLTRTSSLTDKGLSTKQALESAKAAADRAGAALASARASLEIAEANRSMAETDLAKAEIKSPIDGVVLSRDLEPGQIVASSFSAPVLFTLADDLSHMELLVDIDEADMGKVKEGDSASFNVEAFPGREFPATIEQLRYSPATVEGVVTYKAMLSVDNSDLTLRPGMTATADIVVQSVKDATLVPNGALRYSPPAVTTGSRRDNGAGLLGLIMPRGGPGAAREPAAVKGGKGRVFVLRNGQPVEVAVTVGATDGTRTVVTGALADKDVVIVGQKASSP